MNGKQSKIIRKWCEESWNSATIEERISFTDLNHYTHVIKNKCIDDTDFKKFIAWSLNTHFKGV